MFIKVEHKKFVLISWVFFFYMYIGQNFVQIKEENIVTKSHAINQNNE